MRAFLLTLSAAFAFAGIVFTGISLQAGYGTVTRISGITVDGDNMMMYILFSFGIAAVLFAIGLSSQRKN